MNKYFIICLLVFLILWELMFILRRKGLLNLIYDYDDESWLETKILSLSILIVGTMIILTAGALLYLFYTEGLLAEFLITLGAISLFFWLNYLAHKKK